MKNIIIYLKRSFILELKKTIAYPASFWIIVFTIPLYTVVQIVFLETIYGITNNFVGYTKYEAYVLVGTFSMVQALGYLFLHIRLIELKSLIRGGEQESFDLALTRPIDSQIYTTIGRFNFGNIAPFFLSIFVISYGFYNEPHLITLFNLTSYFMLVILGLCIFYITLLFMNTFLFWFPELQMTDALWETFKIFGQYPSGLYRGITGVVLNIVIPITLMASIPVEFLLGRQPPYMLAVYTGIVAVLFILTRLFWKKGVNSYSSFSS